MRIVKSLQKNIIVNIVLIFFITGCSQIIVKPDIKNVTVPEKALVYGNIIYDKTNTSYLPNLIQQDDNTDIVLKYTYNIIYNNGDVTLDGLNLFNPLLFIGFPLSESDLLVSGQLEIIKNENTINTFNSHCIAQKTRNLFNAGGSSEGRKKCLNEIRDNIDSQIFIKYKEKI